MGMFDGWSANNLRDAMQKPAFSGGPSANDLGMYSVTGKGTPWAAPGEKSMIGQGYWDSLIDKAGGSNSVIGSKNPMRQMQDQDLQSWMDMAGGTSKKDQAPSTPDSISFDPNAYQANDYSSLQKAMQRNAGQTAYQSKRGAKAGINPNSADYNAAQAGIGTEYAAQQGDIANQIGGMQAADKYNAYQDALDAQGKEYQRSLQNWQYDVNKEGAARTGAIGRLGSVGGAVAGYFDPALGAAVGVLGQGAAQRYGEGYSDASKKANDSWYNYNKGNTANTASAKQWARSFGQQAGGA